MKKITKELDVDFIGVQGKPLTNEEEQAISEFIRASKAKRKQKAQRTSLTIKRKVKQLV